jgi:uncharacterized membrane protein
VAVPARLPDRSTAALAALLGGAGLLHFAAAPAYERIVPRWLPARRRIVHGSGLAELGCAAGLLAPRTRRTAALSTAVLFVVVFPANVQMALDSQGTASRSARWMAYARLPLQVPLVWWALRLARRG